MMRKTWQGICLAGCIVLGGGGLVNAAAPVPVPTYQQWLQYKAAATNDPALVRFYTFEEVKDMRVNNLAGESGALVFSDFKAMPGEPYAQEFKIVPGRWPEKKAVRIDQCSFLDADYGNQGKGFFTFECWIIVRGYGKIRGASKTGMIAAVGSGYYGGWRLMVDGALRLALQIGGGNGGTHLGAGILDPDAWQHVVVTWDGKTMCTYVNGKIAGKRETGAYVNNKRLVLGYSGSGVGSLDMDVDEAAIYNRALTAEEIARHFNLAR